MMYKTIALELIQACPALYEELRGSKRLLPAMEAYAIDLKLTHDEWRERLRLEHPGTDQPQIAWEALELAIQNLQLQGLLPSASPRDETELTLDAAIAHIRPHTQPA